MKIIIVGGGQVGSHVARLMLEANNEVKLVEYRDLPLSKIKEFFDEDMIIEGNGAEPDVLRAAGIKGADVVAALTGKDEVNLVVSTIAKFEFGVKRVIARVNNPKNDWLYGPEMGVDIKVNQASLLSHIIADQVDLTRMITLMRLNRGNNAIINATVGQGSVADGKAVKELDIPMNTVLIAVERGDESTAPRGETILKAGDHILAYTTVEDEEKLHNLL